MDRICKDNPDTTYKPNQGRYLQLISAKDLYIQNITVSEHDSFQVKFPNVFTNYPLGAVRVEDQRFIDWDPTGGGGAHVKILTGMLVLYFWV